MPEVLQSLEGKARLFFAEWGFGELPSGVEGITVLKRPADLLKHVNTEPLIL
ncbi:hypothetical protein HZC09_06125 [Candidatus Micrarchaeota archaeon]|nr:hypothetical protein [Candidatus Micrarchaeota archaeon]